MAVALRTDPILSMAEGQDVFDYRDEDNLTRLINHLSAKARAWLGRVQINLDTDTAIVENIHLSGPSSVLFAHAPVHNADFDTYECKVEVVSRGVVGQTYLASDDEIIVTTDDFSARLDLAGGYFATDNPGDFLRVTYFGGWSTIPGDVLQGAVYQGRVDAKRFTGEVGITSRSARGQSTSMDRSGVIEEVRDLWRPYRMLV